MTVIIDGQDEWEVAKVLDSRIYYNRLQYYVNWEGYPPEQRTWEPADHLANAPEQVEAFHRDYPLRPSSRDLPTRVTGPRRSSAPRRGVLSGTSAESLESRSHRIRHVRVGVNS